MRALAKLIAAALLLVPAAAGPAQAQEVKVGVVLAYTGVGAELGQQVDRGMELFLKLNPDKVRPYSIKLIKRDEKDPAAPTPGSRCRSCSPRRTSTSWPAGTTRPTRSRRRRSSPPARSPR